jgi:hypothetical protein
MSQRSLRWYALWAVLAPVVFLSSAAGCHDGQRGNLGKLAGSNEILLSASGRVVRVISRHFTGLSFRSRIIEDQR